MNKKILLTTCLLIFLNAFAKAQTQNHSKETKQIQLTKLTQDFKFKEALKFIDEQFSPAEINTPILYIKGNCYRKLGNLLSAEKCYLKIFKKDSTEIQSLNNLAQIAENKANFTQALKYRLLMLQLDADNPYFYKLTAKTCLKSGLTDSAKLLYKKTIELNPNDIDSRITLTNIYIEEENTDAADTVIAPALIQNISNKKLLLKAIQLRYKEEKYLEALSFARSAIVLDPRNYIIHNYLGLINYQTKCYEQCIYWLNKLIERKKENESTYFHLGSAYLELKQYDKAIENLEKAIDKDISNITTNSYLQIGRAYEENKKASEAIAAYHKALDFGAGNNTIFKLASIYDQFYKDKRPALNWYLLYQKNKDSKSNPLIDKYVKSRISALKERIHFEQKGKMSCPEIALQDLYKN
ncbi:MAG: tetratricopeptide repeat protein [Bacteroidales bacterium]